ncbi:Tl.2 family protein [Megaselia abdita]
MSNKVVLILLIFCLRCRAFEVEKFKKEYCTENLEQSSLYCSSLNITISEVTDIQENDFVISNCSHIVFQSAELGVVNNNFFKKFPQAEEIRLSYSSFNLTSSKKVDDLPKLKKLVFRLCTVENINNSNAFESLSNLESLIMEFYLRGNATISKNLLEKNNKLRFLEIAAFKGKLEFSENVLTTLENLKELNIRFVGNISSNLLKNNKKIENLIISSDVMNSFPEDLVIPETVKLLHLNDLKIQNISRKHFEKLKALKVLNLSANHINSFDTNTFIDLENLTSLTMSSNKLSDVTEEHFIHLKNLKKLDLRYNYLNLKVDDFPKMVASRDYFNLLIDPQYTLY